MTNTENAKGQHRPFPFDLFAEGNVGDWQFTADDMSVTIRTPNGTPEGSLGSLQLKPITDWRGIVLDTWQWDGNREAPTFTPSILHTGADGVVWHGYMTKGELISC